MDMKKQFYIFVEGQHRVPEPILAYHPKLAALEWVERFDRDTAGVHGIADGAEVTCHIFDSDQFYEASRLLEDFSSNWLDFRHSTYAVTGEMDVVYYVEQKDGLDEEV